jgi:hypothetical protein
LWTELFPEETIVFRPGGPGLIEKDGSLGMKSVWWRGIRGELRIHGRRLDAESSPLRARIPTGYGETGFQPITLIFPSEGCWEITGELGQVTLSFVTQVKRVTATGAAIQLSIDSPR